MRWPWQARRPPTPTREEVSAAIARLTQHADDIMIAVAEVQKGRNDS
jgi:hypothetical protein